MLVVILACTLVSLIGCKSSERTVGKPLSLAEEIKTISGSSDPGPLSYTWLGADQTSQPNPEAAATNRKGQAPNLVVIYIPHFQIGRLNALESQEKSNSPGEKQNSPGPESSYSQGEYSEADILGGSSGMSWLGAHEQVLPCKVFTSGKGQNSAPTSQYLPSQEARLGKGECRRKVRVAKVDYENMLLKVKAKSPADLYSSESYPDAWFSGLYKQIVEGNGNERIQVAMVSHGNGVWIGARLQKVAMILTRAGLLEPQKRPAHHVIVEPFYDEAEATGAEKNRLDPPTDGEYSPALLGSAKKLAGLLNPLKVTWDGDKAPLYTSKFHEMVLEIIASDRSFSMAEKLAKHTSKSVFFKLDVDIAGSSDFQQITGADSAEKAAFVYPLYWAFQSMGELAVTYEYEDVVLSKKRKGKIYRVADQLQTVQQIIPTGVFVQKEGTKTSKVEDDVFTLELD